MQTIRNMFQHYFNPWHVAARIVEVRCFLGHSCTVRELLNTPGMRMYDSVFRNIAYTK